MTKDTNTTELQDAELENANGGGGIEYLVDVDISGFKARGPKQKSGYVAQDFDAE